MTATTRTGCSTGDARTRWGRAGAALAMSMALALALGLQACGGGGGGDGAPSCALLAGRWDVLQDGVATCSGSFGSGTVSFRAGSQMLVTQVACTISVDDSPSSPGWSGTVAADGFRLVGVPGLGALQGAVVTRTTVLLTGSIAADGRSATFSGSGELAGSKDGVPGACTVASMTMQWNRLDR